jgi:ABC-type spermidine/putrescine transport system permease subunit I
VVAGKIKQTIHAINSPRNRALFLLAPASLYVLIFFVWPIAKLVAESFKSPGNYLRLFSESIYLRVLLNTAELAAVVTAFCLVFGYVFAMAMARSSKRLRNVLLVIVLLPYWTSILVRSYAWLTILQKQGIVNELLLATGIVREPVQLVYNFTGVVCGMSYIMLPYMVLVLYSSIRAIEEQLILVGRTLGSTRAEAFRKILLPLSLPGIIAGSSLVFILSLGYFITPALLGGRQQITFSMLIDVQMNQLLDWRFGSTLSLFLLLITVSLLALLHRVMRLRIPLGWIP